MRSLASSRKHLPQPGIPEDDPNPMGPGVWGSDELKFRLSLWDSTVIILYFDCILTVVIYIKLTIIMRITATVALSVTLTTIIYCIASAVICFTATSCPTNSGLAQL